MNKTGFGFLRPPRLDAGDEKSIDFSLLNTLVDRFLELGGTYFDTAYTYLGGASEEKPSAAVWWSATQETAFFWRINFPVIR